MNFRGYKNTDYIPRSNKTKFKNNNAYTYPLTEILCEYRIKTVAAY